MPHVTVNNANLWYETRGEGRPILLHHGYTASRVNWAPVADRLDKLGGYQVIMMECRGTGESEDTADGYNLSQYAADVIAVVDHLNISKFTYAGHSMGGGVGYVLGLNYADRLDGLILMAPIPAAGIPGEVNMENLNPRLKARNEGNRNFFKKEMIASRFREDVQTDEWFESRVDHLMRVSEGHIVGGMQTMHDLDVEADLAKITTPTLMLAGAVDGLLTANISDYQKLPDATLQVFARAGHDVAIHEPEGVTNTIHEFMQHGPTSAAKVMAQASR